MLSWKTNKNVQQILAQCRYVQLIIRIGSIPPWKCFPLWPVLLAVEDYNLYEWPVNHAAVNIFGTWLLSIRDEFFHFDTADFYIVFGLCFTMKYKLSQDSILLNERKQKTNRERTGDPLCESCPGLSCSKGG